MKLWRDQPDNWTPALSERDKGRFVLGLALCFFVLAAYAYAYPSPSSLSGRWGWLHRMFFVEFGPAGDVVLYSAIGTLALIAGVAMLRERKE